MPDKDNKSWTIEDCREAHLAIKKHPWRSDRDRKYVKDYCRQVEALIVGAYWLAEKSGERDRAYRAMNGMNHDLHGALRTLEATNGAPRRLRNDDGSLEDDYALTLIENTIGVLHRFCDGTPIERYWVYYTGCNNIPGVRRFHAMKWHKDQFIPDLALDELKLELAYFESKDPKWYKTSVDRMKELIKIKEAEDAPDTNSP